MSKAQSNGGVKTSADIFTESGELRDTTRLINQIIEIVPSVVYVRDLRNQKNVFINRSVSESLGYSSEEVKAFDGNFATVIMHPDDFARIPDREGKFETLEDGETGEFEYRMRHKSGEWRWFLSRDSVFLRDEAGKPMLVIGTATDITARKLVEEKLKESEDRFQLAFAAVQSVIYDWNVSLDTISRSAELKNLLGFDNGEPGVATNAWYQTRLHPEDAERAVKLVKEVIESGADRFEDEYRLQHKNGHYVWVRDSGVFLKDKTGKTVRCVGSIRNIDHRKRTEKALSESEERLRLAAQASGFGFHDYDVEKDSSIWSPELRALVGIGADVPIKMDTVLKQIHPDDRARINKAMRASFAPNSSGEFAEEFRIIRADTGKIRWFYNRSQTFFAGKGKKRKPVRNTGIVVDITERKRAEEELRESEERFRLASDAAAAEVYQTDLTGKQKTVAYGLERVTGYTSEEAPLTGDWWHSLIHPEDLPDHLENLERQLSSGNSYKAIHRLRHKSGEWIWVEDTGNIKRNEKGEPVQLTGTVVDITTRKSAEEKLLEEKRLSQSIIEAAPSLIYIFDIASQTNQFISPLSLEILGYTPDEIHDLGTDILFLLLHPDDKARAAERFEKILADRDGETFELEYRMRRKDRNYIWLFDRVRVFRRDQWGKPTRILGVATDITLRKAAEEARQQFVTLIEETNDIVGMARVSGEVLYTNPAGCKLVGLDKPYSRTRIPDYHPPSVAKMIKETAIPQVLEKGFWEGETQFINFKTGEIIDTYQKIFPIRNPKTDELICLATTATDITERKRSEEALRASERRFRGIFNHQFQFSGLLTPDGKIVQLSDSALRNAGLYAEDSAGQMFLDMIWWRDLPETRQKWQAQFAEALEKNVSSRAEASYVLPDGSLRYAINTVTVLRDENGDPEFLLVEGADITERKKAEERLQKRNEQLNLLSRVSQLLIFGKQTENELLETVFSEVSRTVGAEMYFNYQPTEEVSMRLNTWGGLTDDELELFATMNYGELLCGRVAQHRQPVIIEDIANTEFEGSEAVRAAKYTAYAGFPLLAGERLLGTVAFVKRDETHFADGEVQMIKTVCDQIAVMLDRLRLAEGLRKSEERFRSIFESIDEGFCIVEMIFDEANNPVDYRFEQANPAFTRLTGLPADALGKTALELVPDLEYFWIETYGRVAQTGEAVRFENNSVPMNRWFDVHASRVGDGDSRRVAIVFNNITARKIEELNQKLLLRVSELIRKTDDANKLFAQIARLLGRRLSVSRCVFNEIDRVDETLTIRSEYRRKNLPSLIGTSPLGKYSHLTRREIEDGHTVVVADTQTDSRTVEWFETTYQPNKIRSYIAFPLMQDGVWRATCWAADDKPREWQDWEISLMQTVGERAWLAAEKIRSAKQVRESEERFRLAADAAEMFSWENDLPSGKIKWSQNAAKVLGCRPEDLPTESVESDFFVLPNEKERIWREFEQAIATGASNYNSEFYGINDKYWQSHGLIIRDDEGKPLKIIGVTQDITDRKRYEEKLQTANYRFQIAEAAAKGFNYEWNLQSGKITRSLSIERVLGYRRENLPTTWEAWADLIHPDDRVVFSVEGAIEFLNKLNQDNFGSEYRVRHHDGHYIWVMERGLIIRDEAGKPVRIIGQTVDVTENKEQEVRLRLSEERYRALVEASAQIVWTMDADGRGDSHRHWFSQLTGKPIEELKGKGYLEFIHPEDQEFLQKTWQKIMKTPQPYVVEFRLKPNGREYRYYNLRGVPLLEEDGTLREWIGTVRDITERKFAEESLRESEEYRRLLIESAHDYAIIGISVEGIILSWNTGAERIFGYMEDEIIGQSAYVLFTPEDRKKDAARLEIETALQTGSASDERWHIRKDGSRFYSSGVLHQLRSESDQLLGFVKIARDQTEKLAAEKAIREREMLKKVVGALEDERQRIARDLHDELGQQLTALRLKLEHCRKLFPEEIFGKEIDEIQSIAQNIDKGVDFIAWQFRPAALDDLGLYAALDKFVGEWSKYSGVEVELLPSSLKNVRFSSEIETNIYRIAQEALNNINKHAQAKRAELFLERRDNLIIMIIADDGSGFDPTSKKILDKGIGLIGMQERATLIDGTLEIESAHDEGTTVYVRVPVGD